MAIFYFTNRNYVITIPLTDCQHYDLLCEKGNKTYKVQVKTTSAKNYVGNYKIKLSRGKNGEKRIVDEKLNYLFIMTENYDCYCIPHREVVNNHELTITKKFDKFKVLNVSILK